MRARDPRAHRRTHRPRAARCSTVMTELSRHGGSDPVSALAAPLRARRTARLARCGWCYELRLHRARGYGALKAILEILAEEEPLTLTEIAQRLQRTPGSTKDYLSWLEDVDLVTSRQKRYSFTDPLLRALGAAALPPVPPTEDEIAREVHQYALARLPQARARTGAGRGRRRAEDEREDVGDHRDRLTHRRAGSHDAATTARGARTSSWRHRAAAPSAFCTRQTGCSGHHRSSLQRQPRGFLFRFLLRPARSPRPASRRRRALRRETACRGPGRSRA